MNQTTCPSQPAHDTETNGELAPPAWAEAWVAGSAITQTVADGVEMTLRETGMAALLTARWREFTSLPRGAAIEAAQAVYLAIAATLPQQLHSPVRFWNHIPGIHDAMGEGMDRYMAFNAGRFAGFSQWLGSPSTFPRSVATASGIGHFGRDLVIHVLASRHAGVAVHNPRQTPPFAYSQRFGPRPPCFARATLLSETGLLLIGGTASIRGEESVNLGDLAGQLQETLINLDALVGRAGEMAGHAAGLASIHDLRIYHPRREDAPTIRQALAKAMPNASSVQFVHADLCRRELLVEIEGLAQLRPQGREA